MVHGLLFKLYFFQQRENDIVDIFFSVVFLFWNETVCGFVFIYIQKLQRTDWGFNFTKTKKHLEAAGLDAGPSDWRAKPFFFPADFITYLVRMLEFSLKREHSENRGYVTSSASQLALRKCVKLFHPSGQNELLLSSFLLIFPHTCVRFVNVTWRMSSNALKILRMAQTR